MDGEEEVATGNEVATLVAHTGCSHAIVMGIAALNPSSEVGWVVEKPILTS
jgi:hypothetical protein